MKIKIVCLIFILCFSGYAFAQKQKPWSRSDFDHDRYHLGALLSFNSATYYVKFKEDFGGNDSLVNILLRPQPGFNIHFVAQLNLTPNFNLRFVPGLDFHERKLVYTIKKDTGIDVFELKLESVPFILPVYLKWRTDRINNFAAYAIGGGYFSMDVMHNRKLLNNGSFSALTIQTTRNDWGYAVGGGFDFFLPYFKFGIELKYNVGMKNVLVQDGTYFANPLESVRNGSWVFSLTFEG
ncbi:MAG TPA: outer membrane beta-barrel protein [Flavobacteriales bacterium]|nr:outer membrane beta-barrel protein [Flavobacteriales bacterium]